MNNNTVKTMGDLNCMSLSELKNMARDRKIKGRSKKNRAQLRQLIYEDMLGSGVEDLGGQSVSGGISEDFDEKIRALNTMAVKDLRVMARTMKIKGRGNKKACDLQNMILARMKEQISDALMIPAGVSVPPIGEKKITASDTPPPLEVEPLSVGDVIKPTPLTVIIPPRDIPDIPKPVKIKKAVVVKKKKGVVAKKKKIKTMKKPGPDDGKPSDSTIDKEDAEMSEWVRTNDPILIIGASVGDGKRVSELLFTFGADGTIPGLFLGPDVDGSMVVNEGSRGLNTLYSTLPDFKHKFAEILVVGGSKNSLGRCSALKKYSRKDSIIIINKANLKGCSAFKKKLAKVDAIVEDVFPGFGMYRRTT